MNRADIVTSIREILATIAPEQDLTALPMDADIQQTLEIDSYDFLNLMIRINKRFGCDIPEERYGTLGTLERLADFLDNQK
jgi:acyl carrier protein